MRISEVIFYVSNIKQAVKFYNSLGFTINIDHGDYVGMTLKTDKTLLSLNANDKYTDKRGKCACVYLAKGFNQIHNEWIAASPKHVSKILKTDWGEYFSSHDMDGNTIEVMRDK